MVPFTKMHGLSNDFIILDHRNKPDLLPIPLMAALTDRRKGVGADGVVCLLPPTGNTHADLRMRIFNAPDGSEAQTCGNALRCVAALVMAQTGQSTLRIETLAGTAVCTAAAPDGKSVCVDMGVPRFPHDNGALTPLGSAGEGVLVDMGNPHCVLFVPDCAHIPLAGIAAHVTALPLFPEGVNVECVEIRDRKTLRMRVWERGAGETAACGSGACAALAAAVRCGLAERHATVHLDGGDLDIHWRDSDQHIHMTGAAKHVFEGIFDPETLTF